MKKLISVLVVLIITLSVTFSQVNYQKKDLAQTYDIQISSQLIPPWPY